ncbi:MAG: gamma-glutamylcyclotransferase, partial [Candidatus Competibacterales bacterium]
TVTSVANPLSNNPPGVTVSPSNPDADESSRPDAASHPPPLTLDRTTIASGAIQNMIRNSGLPIRVLSDAELEASLDATLAVRPPGAPIWLFAYGSLIWNPAFHYAEKAKGELQGWHRQFCLATPLGRGSPDCPGLVLALDKGGHCQGLVYRIDEAYMEEELAVVWRREMVTGAYHPHWAEVVIDGARVQAIVFTINPEGPNYRPHLSEAEVAQCLAKARGQLGSSADYLFRTAHHLEAMGIHDPLLSRLVARVNILLATA